MGRQYKNAEQTFTAKPMPSLVVLCLVSVAILTPASALATAQTPPQHAQFQDIKSTPPPHQRIEPGEAPDGLSNRDWASIQGQIAAAKYRAFQHENNGFVSSNPTHGWQIRYAADGTTTLKPRDRHAKAWHLGLKLSAVGFKELQTLDRPEQITTDKFTVTYQWNDYLREWWVNTATDLEQWFELEQRPPGAENGQPLTLEMTLSTDLAASQHGNALSFVNATGTTISYNKLQAWDASGRELPARMQLAANTLSLIIDDSDASYPLTIDPSFEQQAYFKASNTGGGDLFGNSVAISGDTLVVGAWSEDSNATGINGNQGDNSATDAGAVYVFTRSGTVWSQQAYLKASNTGGGDFFGTSVAISDDTIVVGAGWEDSNATGVNGDQSNNSVNNAGSAYVFTRSGTVWSQQAYLKASNTDVNDHFGWSVAISGDTLVVSTFAENSSATGINGNQGDNSATDAGAAYVFTRSGTVWSQQAYLKASNTGGGDEFGNSVAISGDTLVVGALREDSSATGINGDQSDNSAPVAGAAYVYTRNGMTWSQQAYLKASNTDVNDHFGRSVAISGDTLVVGAFVENSGATSINGDQDNNSAFRAGAAYVFTRNGTTWSQQAYLKASNTGRRDNFGWFVAISGNTLVVAANEEDSNATGINGDQGDNSVSNSGAVYVFTRNGTTWSQQAYLKASNTGGGDFFGTSVAISGNTLVVGAIEEGSNATGINGDQSDNSAVNAGAAYVFVGPFTTDGFKINAGLNDAWFNSVTSGQGFLITVFPDRKEVFLAWFTYDTERPPEDVIAQLGEPGHRWLTAQGPYEGDTATLTIFVTKGGVFNAADPVASTDPDGDGTMTIEFADCTEGLVNYRISSLDISGEIPIQRITPDNVALCEALASP
jgi:hypothetical protein